MSNTQQPFTIITPQSRWIDANGAPTPEFFRVFHNIYVATGSGQSGTNLQTVNQTVQNIQSVVEVSSAPGDPSATGRLATLERKVADLTTLLATLPRPPVNNPPSNVFQSATVTSGAAVTLTSTVAVNVLTLPLPAGRWLLIGGVDFVATITTDLTYASVWTNSVSATNPGPGSVNEWIGNNTGGSLALAAGAMRVTPTSTTTYYLTVQAGFTASSLSAYGTLGAVPVN